MFKLRPLQLQASLGVFTLAGIWLSLSLKPIARNAKDPLRHAVQEATISTGLLETFVVLTAAKYPYRAFVFNLWSSLQKHGKRKLLIMSLNHKMHKYALINGIPTMYFPSDRVTSKLEKFHTVVFSRLVITKLYAVRSVLDAGNDVLFVDSDSTFCYDPEIVMRDVAEAWPWSWSQV